MFAMFVCSIRSMTVAATGWDKRSAILKVLDNGDGADPTYNNSWCVQPANSYFCRTMTCSSLPSCSVLSFQALSCSIILCRALSCSIMLYRALSYSVTQANLPASQSLARLRPSLADGGEG